MKFKKYIPNIISITRIILCILFVNTIITQFTYGHNKTLNLVILFLGICSSDLLDGKIARKTNSVSSLGAKLDVFADLFYIIVSYVVLIDLKILPLWFLGFICFKFSEFVITSKFIKSNSNSVDKPFVFDKIGRIVSATFLIIPGIVCIYKCFNEYNINLILNCILYIIFICGIVSSYYRVRSCIAIYKVNNNNSIN